MRKFVSVAAAAAVLTASIAIGTPAGAASQAAAQGRNKLQCFDGPGDASIYGGNCALTTNGAKGPATLDNTDGDSAGSYSGVYIVGSNLAGKPLAGAGRISFRYTGIPTNASPRISLPLDLDGDDVTDVYASIPAYWCSNGAGLVDAIHNPNCRILVEDTLEPFVGWAAFAAAYPTATMGPDESLPFVIADDGGSTARWTVSSVNLGRPGK